MPGPRPWTRPSVDRSARRLILDRAKDTLAGIDMELAEARRGDKDGLVTSLGSIHGLIDRFESRSTPPGLLGGARLRIPARRPI